MCFFKQKTAYEIAQCLVGSEMCIRDSYYVSPDFRTVTPIIQNISAVSYTHLTLPTKA
ncbi:hypothetical protein JMUB7555_27360 [Staphylococcus aureus]